MITIENLLLCGHDRIAQYSNLLTGNEIGQLVEWLGEKDDHIRYKSFLILQIRSQNYRDVYRYWNLFVEKISSTISYQRSIGIMMIAENIRWDDANKFDSIIDEYLAVCDDKKPITARQCIQSLNKVIAYKRQFCDKIMEKIISINLLERKETQRKLLLVDIVSVLSRIREIEPNDKIDSYYLNVMQSGILDKKAKNEVLKLLGLSD